MIIKDHKDNINRELSLVEQKKQQWAKERGVTFFFKNQIALLLF